MNAKCIYYYEQSYYMLLVLKEIGILGDYEHISLTECFCPNDFGIPIENPSRRCSHMCVMRKDVLECFYHIVTEASASVYIGAVLINHRICEKYKCIILNNSEKPPFDSVSQHNEFKPLQKTKTVVNLCNPWRVNLSRSCLVFERPKHRMTLKYT